MPFPLEWIETLLNLKPKEILPRASAWCLKGTTSDKWYAFAPQSPPTLLCSDAGSQPCQRPQSMSICLLSHHLAKHPQGAASNGEGLTQARVLDNPTFPNPRCPWPCIKVKLGPGSKWDQPWLLRCGIKVHTNTLSLHTPCSPKSLSAQKKKKEMLL